MATQVWFTSDTHFGHEAVIGHSRRPFGSVDEMNEALVEAWNATVAPRDEVYHLGDVEFRSGLPAQHWLQRLHGRITVIKGNHDRPKDLNAAVAAGAIVAWHEVLYLRHRRMKFWLSHYMHVTWPNSNVGSFHLCGHSHGDLLVHGGRRMDVGVDAIAVKLGLINPTGHLARQPLKRENFRPVSFDEVIGWLGAEPHTDHHARKLLMWPPHMAEG